MFFQGVSGVHLPHDTECLDLLVWDDCVNICHVRISITINLLSIYHYYFRVDYDADRGHLLTSSSIVESIGGYIGYILSMVPMIGLG